MTSRNIVNTLCFIILVMLFLFTTGIVLPWIISNVVMPIWMTVFAFLAVIFIWMVILDPIIRKLINKIKKELNHVRIKD